MIKQTEHHLQVEFFKWCAWKSKENGFEPLKLIFAIPNGGHRNIITATRMKAEGVKSGVPDIFLPYAPLVIKSDLIQFIYHKGLFLEAKSKKGRLSDNQKWWRYELIKAGYAFAEFRTLDEARSIVTNYLNGTLKIKEITNEPRIRTFQSNPRTRGNFGDSTRT